jgi:hypothetical protein
MQFITNLICRVLSPISLATQVIRLAIILTILPALANADDSVLFPQLKSESSQTFGGNWVVTLSNDDGKVRHQQHIVMNTRHKHYCEPVAEDICNYRITDDPKAEWVSGYIGDGNIYPRSYTIIEPYTIKYEHAYGIIGHWGADSKVIISRDRGVGKWEYGEGNNGKEVWVRLRPKINKITFGGVGHQNEPPVSSVAYGSIGRVTGIFHERNWGPTNNAPGNRDDFIVNIYGENLWGHHIFDVKKGTGLSPNSCQSIQDDKSKNFMGHIGLRCSVKVWHGTTSGIKILRLDNLEIPFNFDITGLVASKDPEPEKKVKAKMELQLIKPEKLKLPANSSAYYYPIDPTSAVVFELKNIGDKPLEEIQLIFKLNHGSIKQFTVDGKTCAWNQTTASGGCGFVSIEQGKSKKVGLMLHITGLDLTRETNYIDKLKIETTAKAQGIKDKNVSVEIKFEECAAQYQINLIKTQRDRSKRYRRTTYRAMNTRDDYPKERTHDPKSTKSTRVRDSNALVLEMIKNRGNDAYLANGGAVKGQKGIRDLVSEYIKALPGKTIGGNICGLPSDPAAKAIMRAKEFKKRAKEISIRAERDRREAQRWAKAIHDTLKDLGPKTTSTLKQGSSAPEDSKAIERKVEMFSFSQGMQGLSNYFRVGLVQSAALGRTLGFLSLALSSKQIVESTWDTITLARISLLEVFQGLAAIETAAHMQVLDKRYKAIDKANDAIISELNEIYKKRCSCKIPFE